MSILNNLTSVLEPIKLPGIISGEDCKPEAPQCEREPEKECKPTKNDECGDGKQSWNSDKDYSHSKDYSKDYGHSKDDGGWKDAKNDDCEQHNKDYGDSKQDGGWKDAKNDDYEQHNKDYGDSKQDGGWKDAKNDNYEQHNKDYGDSKQDGGWKDAKNDDCEHQKDYCQPQNESCETKPSQDCGSGDTYHNTGEMLAKFDFSSSHGDLGSYGADHSSDMQGALASMSSGHALDYAIGQMGPADHFDVGHFDAPADTSHHDVGHVA
jgi:ribosome modulation factor